MYIFMYEVRYAVSSIYMYLDITATHQGAFRCPSTFSSFIQRALFQVGDCNGGRPLPMYMYSYKPFN